MQGFARRVAGLGRLPSEAEPVHRSARRIADVVVVGGGPSGLAIAAHAAARGRSVEVIDDQLEIGGSLLALSEEEARSFAAIRAELGLAVHDGRVWLRSSTVAGGIYGDDLLVSSPEGAEVLEPRALVLASGAHDGVLAFEGNDLPGVMSARAAALFLHHGVAVGERVVIVVPRGGGPFGASYARAIENDPDARKRVKVEIVYGEPLSVDGTSSVKRVKVATGIAGRDRELECDALLVDAPRAPAYELAAQAGAVLVHEPRGFVVNAQSGRIRDGVYAAGELTGIPFDVTAFEDDAKRIVARL